MKQITVDYGTYLNDLRIAKEEGFELTRGLVGAIESVLVAHRDPFGRNLKKAMFELEEIYKKLQQVEVKP
jgi:hypothetical protein